METNDIILLAVTLIILGEVSYLLAKLPRTSIKGKDRAILIDTSVLIDGRIVSVARTGFIGGNLVVPRSVIGELQFLADNADADKRMRARHGLDVVSELQQMDGVEVEILQDGSRAREGVDDRLLTLAKENGAVIMTLDYNLNKVAVVEGITVLNLNELAQSIRMEHLPGEQITLELIQKGQDSHQGVGYLPDGTMVVVEQASAQIGQTLQVEIIRSLQTAAGRMIFAKKLSEAQTKLSAPNTKVVKTRASGRAPRLNDDKPAAKPSSINAKSNSGKPQEASGTSRLEGNVSATSPKKSRKTRTKDDVRPRANPTEKPAGSPRRSQRRRTNHEDDLIKLVNNQD